MYAKKRKKKYFGMSGVQLSILAILTFISCGLVTSLSGLIIATYFVEPFPTQFEIAVLPTIRQPTETHQPTRTPTLTKTPKPTLTPRPTITPSPSITATPTLWFRNRAEFYTPKLENMPQNFYAISIGYNYTSQGNEFYQAIFENSFPNIKGTDDVYLVHYDVMVFPNEMATQKIYNDFNIAFFATLELSATSAPIETPITIQGVQEVKMFLIHIKGVNVPGIRCMVIVRDKNLFAVIETLVHDTGNSTNKAINQAQYFASLLAAKLK